MCVHVCVCVCNTSGPRRALCSTEILTLTLTLTLVPRACEQLLAVLRARHMLPARRVLIRAVNPVNDGGRACAALGDVQI